MLSGTHKQRDTRFFGSRQLWAQKANIGARNNCFSPSEEINKISLTKQFPLVTHDRGKSIAAKSPAPDHQRIIWLWRHTLHHQPKRRYPSLDGSTVAHVINRCSFLIFMSACRNRGAEWFEKYADFLKIISKQYLRVAVNKNGHFGQFFRLKKINNFFPDFN